MPEGKYIYCIIKEREDKREVNPVRNRRFLNGVNLVHYKDIAAVVSDTPIINFDRLDKKKLTKHVAVHQRVQEAVMKKTDVIPMSFGIIAPSIDEVRRILEKAYLQFKATLKKTAGKVEFAVQVWWDKEGLLSEVLPFNHETVRKAYIKDIQDVLGDIAEDSTLNKLIAQDMLASFSFLIEKNKEATLDRKMQELGKKYEGKLRFKYIGPMPPYSFSNINLSLGNFELVDKARKMLGLKERGSLQEIKQAYRELAHRYHPDKKGDEEKFKEIAQAYNILETYCQSCLPSQILRSKTWEGEREKENQKYSFKKADIQSSIIIIKT